MMAALNENISNKLSGYFNKIDELSEGFVRIWQDVCNIESPTGNKDGVDAVGEYIIALAEQRGWKTERFLHDVSGNVVAITMNQQIDAAPIALSGHMDTVHPIGSFGTPATVVEDGNIYGPGVCDCKGGIVASLLAMDALYICGYSARPVMLLLQSDEENGSKASKKATIGYICEKSKNAIAFLNMEGHTEGEGCLIRKGIITYLFTVSGIAAHSSKSANEGANAIAEAAHKILEIEKIKDADGITCCSSIISGGSAVNTVPDSCEFKVNVRYASEEQLKWVENKMKEIADTVYIKGCKTALSTVSFRTSMEYSQKNQALLDKINEAFKISGLPTLKASKRTGGSDAADVTAYGIPCIDSLGVRGGKIHTADEFAIVDSLTEAAKRIVAVVDYFA